MKSSTDNARCYYLLYILATLTTGVNAFLPDNLRCLRTDFSARCAVAVTDEKTNKFLAWAETEGIKAPKCRIAKFPGGLRGIGAVEEFPDDFYSVSVPAELVIETNNNRPLSPFLDFCSESFWSEQCKWDHRLALKLIYEVKGFQEKSNKQPWLDKLPKSFSTPLHWSENELAKTQYSALELKVRRQRNDWEAFYARWINHIEKSSKISAVSFEDFVWSMECVNSRAFSGIYEGSTASERRGLYLFTGALTLIWPLAGLGTAEQSLGAAVLVAISIITKDFFFSRAAGLKRYVICPYIDMFNHQSTCTSDVSYGYFTDTFELKTQAYKEGDQIFISYGKQSNDRLLQYYGFTDQKNPYDLYDFGVTFLELILKYADQINEEVSLPSLPSPQDRLQQIATALQNTVLESSKDSLLQKNTLTLSSGDDKTTRYFKTVSSSTGLASHFDDVTVRSMRALYSTTDEWNALVKQSGGNTDLRSLNNAGVPLSAETERKIYSAFTTLIRLELAEKPTSIEEDMVSLLEFSNKQNTVSSKNSIKGKKGITTSPKKGFQSPQQLDEEKVDTEVIKKVVKNKDTLEVDPSGFYSDGNYAALTFRIEKKKILMDALLKLE